jgi:hypothetical protein
MSTLVLDDANAIARRCTRPAMAQSSLVFQKSSTGGLRIREAAVAFEALRPRLAGRIAGKEA